MLPPAAGEESALRARFGFKDEAALPEEVEEKKLGLPEKRPRTAS
ncbi:MAG: hypothetical protein ACJATN_002234 [Neolewinella sp.]|jgi:hypothetical protein